MGAGLLLCTIAGNIFRDKCFLLLYKLLLLAMSVTPCSLFAYKFAICFLIYFCHIIFGYENGNENRTE